ncbi:MAG: metal ABC transporter ATP-binding protein [Alphaproteobacteria bacterium]
MGKSMILHPHQKKIEIKNLFVSYGKTQALTNISGTFQPNTLTAIIGPNGGGKSTLIKAIQNQVRIEAGSIKHNCKNKCESGYLPQQADLDKTFPLTVREVVGMGLWPKLGSFTKYTTVHQEQITEALTRVGLLKFEHRRIDSLSGGQFQRMLFARIYVQDASLIILDEPFTAIDAQTCTHLINIILEWHKQGKTILVVLHNLDLVKKYFPETLLLGRSCIGWGPTKSVLTQQNLNHAFQNLLN